MAASYIGFDNLKTVIGQYNSVSALDIYMGSKKTSTPFAICSVANGDIWEQFERVINTVNPDCKDNIYTIVLRANKKEISMVTWALEPKEKTMAVNGTPQQATPMPANMDKYMELYMEVGYLRAENKRLNAENSQLLADVAELTAELDEAEVNGTNDPMDKIKEYLPYIASIFGKPVQTNAVNGVEDHELNGIINELQTIDPEFKDNMFKLLKLAKNKPMIYKMAVGYLNSL